LPKLEPSIANWTDPVGAAVPVLADTVAVKVTLCPDTDWICDELTFVVVSVLLLTVRLALPLLVACIESPP
jgi:hypothetical protein